MTAILIFFHCPSNTGYAIRRLEHVFVEVGRRITGRDAAVHFAYTDLSAGQPDVVPATMPSAIEFKSASADSGQTYRIAEYIREHAIDVALGFDQPARRPGFAVLRQSGIRTFVSYWGAPMSDLNRGLKLALRRADVFLARRGPDHYVFESEAMRLTAVEGRGIPASKTSVTYLGVDPDVFRPNTQRTWYAHDLFGIPRNRRIVYYSGHMEPRKGVDVIIRAAVELIDGHRIDDVHFLLFGNQHGEEAVFEPIYRGRFAASHITFGGYRSDVERIIPECYVGTIASTGWDSFTMSSVEIAASGVPLIVSRLGGLQEAIEEGETGFTFAPGDYKGLADRLRMLLDDPVRRDRMSDASRLRVLAGFTVQHQIESLVSVIHRVDAARQHSLAY